MFNFDKLLTLMPLFESLISAINALIKSNQENTKATAKLAALMEQDKGGSDVA